MVGMLQAVQLGALLKDDFMCHGYAKIQEK